MRLKEKSIKYNKHFQIPKKKWNIFRTNSVKVTKTTSHTINHLTSFNYGSIATNDTVINDTDKKNNKKQNKIGQKSKFP